ncbi:hypothetical protein [Streptomyces nigrescens]|uniref:hypothetical protein n=1 Tax=Streptomyces nigrescens TaxID=1920 RepID=UPI00346BFD90
MGLEGFGYLARERDLVTRIAEQFNAPRGELSDKITVLLDRLKAADRENARLKAQATAARAAELAASAEHAGGTAVVATAIEGGPDETRALSRPSANACQRPRRRDSGSHCRRRPGGRAQPGPYHHPGSTHPPWSSSCWTDVVAAQRTSPKGGGIPRDRLDAVPADVPRLVGRGSTPERLGPQPQPLGRHVFGAAPDGHRMSVQGRPKAVSRDVTTAR